MPEVKKVFFEAYLGEDGLEAYMIGSEHVHPADADALWHGFQVLKSMFFTPHILVVRADPQEDHIEMHGKVRLAPLSVWDSEVWDSEVFCVGVSLLDALGASPVDFLKYANYTELSNMLKTESILIGCV